MNEENEAEIYKKAFSLAVKEPVNLAYAKMFIDLSESVSRVTVEVMKRHKETGADHMSRFMDLLLDVK